ncbi:RsmB/NOP family class I SAM-dependent RNA methyltransferase [Parasphingorhabdus sp. DH2-15]|uniref:RsmB/NOP family class I SAM-dependent RNA methyltransferase n=1 Tax=Parasphingorhabdus sp. DH2-15 TaxID=3444112 RepID=UPI003F682E24
MTRPDSSAKPERNPKDESSGVETRRAALAMLESVLRRGDTLDVAQNTACKKLTRSDDAAFALAIVAETLRNLGGLDELLDGAMKKPLADHARPRFVLRLMLAQSLILGTPAHAVIATGLPLLAGGPRRLAHGVFSAIDKQRTALENESLLPDPPWLPPEVQERWQQAWGDDMTVKARKGFAKAPPIDLTVRDADKTDMLAEKLGAISMAARHLRLAEGVRLSDDPDFNAGDYWVQNLAASLPARLLGEGEGRTVLDLCAAPGGKTMQLAAQDWNVTALDSSKKRLKRLQENLDRTGLKADIVTTDLRVWEAPTASDAILLDAPCTATGTYRRNPDVLYRIGENEIQKLTSLQRTLLDRAAKWVKPGGQLVYAVCSLEPEEGEEQVQYFLEKHSNFTLKELPANALPQGIAADDNGCLRILPGMMEDQGGLDGFFVASFQRSE